jgi:hypothetical protein
MATYQLSYFKDLVAAYPTWNALSAHLRSEAGGGLIITEECNNKVIIHYDKRSSNMTADHVRWSRSVVWDTVANRPIAIAPPKAAEPDDTMMDSIGAKEGWTYQDYLEGVTLNVWSEGSISEIASRTRFGADAGFYSSKTFKDMLADALDGMNIGDLIPAGYTFISVLLQHPEHRVVEKVAAPAIFRLHAGRCDADGTVTIDEGIGGGPDEVDAPDAEQTVKAWFGEMAAAKPWEWQGIVMKDGAGHRWRLRSNSYRMVRSLRGSMSRADERFFALRRAGLVKTYLYYYPEDKQLYWRIEKWLRSTTNSIYAAYCDVYKAKAVELDSVAPMFRTHVRGLHAKYLAELRPAGKTVNHAEAVTYMNGQPVPRLLFMLNFENVAQTISSYHGISSNRN